MKKFLNRIADTYRESILQLMFKAFFVFVLLLHFVVAILLYLFWIVHFFISKYYPTITG